MEETTWEQRLQALTHILTTPTTKPSLHSQFFIGTLIPCYLSWDYPPILCHSPRTRLREWWVSQFLKRASRFGLPDTSWRSNCPYYQPSPAVMAGGVEEGKWGREERSVCEEKAEEEEAGERSESFYSSFGSESASLYSLVVGSYS